MKDQTKSSHECDALGGISKSSQKRIVPDDVVIRTDVDLTRHLREREKANAATSPSVAGIPELTPHANKKDLPPTASGKTTRTSKDSDGVISRPNGGTTGDHPDVCDALGNPGRRRQNQHEFDAKERPVEKLRESRRRQLGSNGMQGN